MRVAFLQHRVNCTARYDQRRRHLIDVCDKKRQSGARRIPGDDLDSIVPSDYYYLFVDDVHKVLYCTVPKASVWMMINVTGGHWPDELVDRQFDRCNMNGREDVFSKLIRITRQLQIIYGLD